MNLDLKSVAEVVEMIRAKAESTLLTPAENSLRYLLHFIHGEKRSEEEVHANDDSEDYPQGYQFLYNIYHKITLGNYYLMPRSKSKALFISRGNLCNLTWSN